MPVPMVQLKKGVVLEPLTPALIRLIGVTDQAVRILGRDLTITCGREGHIPNDPHTRGEAIDIRTRDLSPGATVTLYEWLKVTLGAAWTVLYEVREKPDGDLARIAYVNQGASAPHLHIQPRKGTRWPPQVVV
jgi:hypothetical protein